MRLSRKHSIPNARSTRAVVERAGQSINGSGGRSQLRRRENREVTRRDPPRIAFLFTGQGAQYAGMARQLDAEQPAFRTALDRCARVLDPLLQRPLRDLLFSQSIPSELDQTGVTQPALFALEYGLSEMWRAWGVVPQVAIGHSVGELVAACVAGAISLDDALSLTAERGRLMQSLPAGGAMAAVNAPELSVATAMLGQEKILAIAAINGPEQSVISGDAAAVRTLCSQFTKQGIRWQALEVSHAFHSPLVDPILDAFEAAASKVVFSKPRLRVISSSDWRAGRPDRNHRPRLAPSRARSRALADGIRALAAMEPDVCIEVGPQPTLLSFVSAMSTAFGDHMPVMVLVCARGAGQGPDYRGACHVFVTGVALKTGARSGPRDRNVWWTCPRTRFSVNAVGFSSRSFAPRVRQDERCRDGPPVARSSAAFRAAGHN